MAEWFKAVALKATALLHNLLKNEERMLPTIQELIDQLSKLPEETRQKQIAWLAVGTPLSQETLGAGPEVHVDGDTADIFWE